MRKVLQKLIVPIFILALLLGHNLYVALANNYISSVFLIFTTGGVTPITSSQTIRLSLWSDGRLESNDISGGNINLASSNYAGFNTAVVMTPDSEGRLRIGFGSVPNFPAISPQNQFLMIERKNTGDPNTAYVVYKDVYINNLGMDRFPLIENGPDIYQGIYTNNATTGDTFTVDRDSSSTTPTIQFGKTLAKTIQYDSANTRFVINDNLRIQGNEAIVGQEYIANDHSAANSDGVLNLGRSSSVWQTLTWNSASVRFDLSGDLNIGSHQVLQARLENVSALPGGAGGLGTSGKGRIVQLTATDGVAPGCTSPTCASGTYTWDGSTWHSLQGSITTSNATKIVTVGPTGRDYTTIAAAAAYLNTLSGGEMWVDAGTFPVTTVVDLANIKMRGADLDNLTNIALSGGGKLLVDTTKFEMVTITVDAALSSSMAMDVKYDAANHSAVEFSQVNFIINGSKVGINSTAATAPYLVATFNICTESGTGSLMAPMGSSNLNASSYLTVINLLSTSPLKISDWPVTIVGGSNVVTSGIITTVPDRTIIVSPGMNVQGAINSLGSNGGVIKLLVGTHDITTPLLINNNNIKITGEGPGTILRAQTGTWTGGTTVNDCALQVGAANGTSPRNNIIVEDFQLQVGPNIHGVCINGGLENKVLDMNVVSIGVKSTPGPRTAIVFTDGATSPGSRFTASRNIISSDVASNRWNDGIHFDGNAVLSGQIYGYGNGITDSIISENQVNEATQTSYDFSAVSASGIFSNRARNLGYSSGALGLFLSDSQDVTVINNSLEGNNNAATNGIYLYSNVNDSAIIGNVIRGGPSNFASGISILTGASASNRNIIESNQFQNVTTLISDNGVGTKYTSIPIRSTSNPAVTDDISKGYAEGTIWVNTSTGVAYVSVNSTAGAAVWTSLSSPVGLTGTTSNTWTLDTDNTGGNVSLQFGQNLAKTLTWDGTNNRFTFNDSVDVAGAFSTQAADVTVANGTNNNLAIPNATFVRVVGPTSSFTITGFTGGYDGRILILYNTTSNNMSFSNNTTSSTANRILTNTGLTVSTSGTGSAMFVYDASQNRWIMIATAA